MRYLPANAGNPRGRHSARARARGPAGRTGPAPAVPALRTRRAQPGTGRAVVPGLWGALSDPRWALSGFPLGRGTDRHGARDRVLARQHRRARLPGRERGELSALGRASRNFAVGRRDRDRLRLGRAPVAARGGAQGRHRSGEEPAGPDARLLRVRLQCLPPSVQGRDFRSGLFQAQPSSCRRQAPRVRRGGSHHQTRWAAGDHRTEREPPAATPHLQSTQHLPDDPPADAVHRTCGNLPDHGRAARLGEGIPSRLRGGAIHGERVRSADRSSGAPEDLRPRPQAGASGEIPPSELLPVLQETSVSRASASAYSRRQSSQVKLAGNRAPQTHDHPSARAGFPATSACAGTSRVTTAPAPTNAYSPMVTPQTMVALAPMVAPRRTIVSPNSSRFFLNPTRGRSTLVKTALGPTNTSSSRRTPSQMRTAFLMVTRLPITAPVSTKAWSPTLQRLPMRAPFMTWANAQMRVPSPTWSLSQSPRSCTKKSLTLAPARPVPQHPPRFNVIGQLRTLW